MGKRLLALLTVSFVLVLASCQTNDSTIPATSTATAATSQAATSQAATSSATTQAATSTPATSAATPTTGTRTATSTPPASSTASIGSILGKAAGVKAVSYEMVVSGAGDMAITSRIWQTQTRIRIETKVEGLSMVMLVDNAAQTIIVYLPSENMALVQPWEAQDSALGEAQEIIKYSPVISGTETVDGHPCTVISYTAEGATVKAWIWTDKGLPVKIESTDGSGNKATIKFNNFNFDLIADSMFQLPLGVTPSSMPPIPIITSA